MQPIKEGWVSHLHFSSIFKTTFYPTVWTLVYIQGDNAVIVTFITDSLYIFRDGEGDILYCFVPGDEQMACLEASGVVLFAC